MHYAEAMPTEKNIRTGVLRRLVSVDRYRVD